MEATTLRYELSGDKQGLKKWFRGKDGTENFYHVHADEMTELEQWLHGLLSTSGTTDGLVRHPGLYRAQLSCKIGRDVLEGKTQCPDGVQPMEWAMFNLLHAVDEIARAMTPNNGA